MFIQKLEPRRLLTGVTHTGTLVIDGTDASELINISRNAGTITVQVKAALTVSARFATAEVKRILVLAGGGADNVQVDHDVVERATIVGGAGNDILAGNYGATLIGGSGNDHLYVPTRTQYDVDKKETSSVPGAPDVPALLSGGIGDDMLIADRDDVFVGGKGSDTLAAAVHAVKPPGFLGGTADTFEVADVIDLDAVGDAASGVERVLGDIVNLNGQPISVTVTNDGSFHFNVKPRA